jgi:hypothetical protein
MARIDEIQEAIARIQMYIDNYDAVQREPEDNEEDLDETPVEGSHVSMIRCNRVYEC